MNAVTKAAPSHSNSLNASVRDRSNSELVKAILSPNGDDLGRVEAYIVERTNTAINIGFVPDWSPAERLAVIDEYRKALRCYPFWVVERAFDSATREIRRRPSPGELITLSERAKKPVVNEIKRRQREREAQEEAERQRNEERVSPEAAAEIMATSGFAVRRMTDGPVRLDVTPEEIAEWKARGAQA